MKSNFLYKIFSYPFRFTKKSFKILKLSVKHKLGWLGVPIIVAYRGFTNGKMLFISGLVTEDKGLQKPDSRKNVWQNIVSMLKRYSGDEIPDVELEISVDGFVLQSISDENGFFKIEKNRKINSSEDDPQWIPYEASAEIIDKSTKYDMKSIGEILHPVSSNTFGLISDIDDTIIVSHSTQTLKKLRLMLLRNSRNRKPFSGAAAFYTALHKGYSRKDSNPVFYVSSSEWNLYDLLDDFCHFNGFPKGVFMLKDLKNDILKFWKSGGGSHEHKIEKIRKIMSAFPDMKFVLIGDNGQKDPDIYSRVVDEFPGRVLAIYIRYIRKKKEEKIDKLISEVKNKGVDMLVVKDSYEAAWDALNKKLIHPDAIPEIWEEKEFDEGHLENIRNSHMIEEDFNN